MSRCSCSPLGLHAFVLSDEPLLAAPLIVVLVPHPLALAAQDYMVNVVGIVGQFNPRVLRREYPWFNAELFDGTDLWEQGQQDGTAVIIAQSVRTEGGLELVRLPAVRPAGAGGFGTGQTGAGRGSKTLPPVTHLGTIVRSDDAAALVGSTIVLAAARVQRVFDPEFIAVGKDIQHSVLVRLAQPNPSIVVGDLVAHSGIIEKSPESWPDKTLTQLLPVFIYAGQLDPVTH